VVGLALGKNQGETTELMFGNYDEDEIASDIDYFSTAS
jgi:hypothetical protein